MQFVQRHVLRTNAGGDPRERALQVVVRLLAGVTDTIRRRLLVERASQVFGMSEGVIARAARLAREGDRAGTTVAAAVRAQRRVESDLERRLLLGLWHAPEQLDTVRAEMHVEEFEDAGARALAAWWWKQGVVLPEGDGAEAVLARELAAGGTDNADPGAETLGILRRLVIRRWERERRQRQSRLGTARGDEAARLMQEIQDIARTLHDLSLEQGERPSWRQ
jgi:hypothetical protein